MLAILFILVFSFDSFAVCPACVLGAGATFGVAKIFGLNNLVIGVFFSGILFASAKWIGDFLGKKTHNILVYPLSFCLHYFSIYFFYGKYLNYKEVLFLNIDCFLFGVITGFFTSLFSYFLYLFLKKRNNNKPHFPYEKVVIYILSLIFVALICNILGSKFNFYFYN